MLRGFTSGVGPTQPKNSGPRSTEQQPAALRPSLPCLPPSASLASVRVPRLWSPPSRSSPRSLVLLVSRGSGRWLAGLARVGLGRWLVGGLVVVPPWLGRRNAHSAPPGSTTFPPRNDLGTPPHSPPSCHSGEGRRSPSRSSGERPPPRLPRPRSRNPYTRERAPARSPAHRRPQYTVSADAVINSRNNMQIRVCLQGVTRLRAFCRPPLL